MLNNSINNLIKEWFKAFLCAINYIIFGIIVIYFMIALSGCSVYMASKGVKTYDPNYVVEGMTRQQILKILGKPVVNVKTKDGRVITDLFIINKSDKASIKRALVHATLDTITIGLWEPFGTVKEMRRDKDYWRIIVQYDEDMRVKKITKESLMPVNLKDTGVDSNVHFHYYYDMSPRTIPGYVPGQTVIVPNGTYYYGY